MSGHGPLDVRARRLPLGPRPLGSRSEGCYHVAGHGTATATAFPTATSIAPTTARWATATTTASQSLRQSAGQPLSPLVRSDERTGKRGARRPAFFLLSLPAISGGIRVPLSADRFGLSVALATPFAEDRSIDLPRLVAHGRQSLADGCTSLTVFGTTGEGASLGLDERNRALGALVGAGVDPARSSWSASRRPRSRMRSRRAAPG